MDNIELLQQSHILDYEEQVRATAHRDHFRNAEFAPLAQQVHQATAHLSDSARQVLCRLEPLQGTAFCAVQVA